MIRFTSRATTDLLMFPEDASALLQIMGRPSTPPGALTPEQLPAAIAALREFAALPVPEPESHQQGGEEPEAQVPLKTKMWPLLQMLERAVAQQKSVVWELEPER